MSVKASFNSLSAQFRVLEQAGLIDALQDWIADVSQLEVPSLDTYAVNLKAIFSSLVDKQFGTVTPKKDFPPQRKPRLQSSHPRQFTPNSSGVLRPNVSPHARKASALCSPTLSRSNSRGGRGSRLVTEDLSDLSDFCFISGAATFKKSKRNTLPVHDPSPGPAAYDPGVELSRQTSPRALIPKSGTRVEFANFNSPGPAAYRPRRHFLAKY